MAKFQKQPMFVYDEPIHYNNMRGGINTNPSNEQVMDGQFRDGFNLTYKGTTLSKRYGAKVIQTINFAPQTLTLGRGKVQGMFTLAGESKDYYVVVRDGLIFQNYEGNLEQDFAEVPVFINENVLKDKFSPLNVGIGLSVLTPDREPDPFQNNEGYILHVKGDTGNLDYHKLVLQNYRQINGVSHDGVLWLATGTRFLKIYEKENLLHGEIVSPKEINAWEYSRIGFNYLSPFPNLCVKNTSELALPSINNIFSKTHYVFAEDDYTDLHVVMDFQEGHDRYDYYYKWEYKLDNNDEYQTLVPFFSQEGSGGRGREDYELPKEIISNANSITVRVTFSSDDFMEEEDTTKIRTRIDKARATFGMTSVTIPIKSGKSEDYEPEAFTQFLDIHSCNKIMADGNKFLLYGARYNKGRWYKTAIRQYDYISDQGGLDFQTNKNEEIIGTAHLEGNIVVFANNHNLGGSIHLVTGSGDDYRDDEYYSPYRRRLIHPNISCDHPNSIQQMENFLLFKYKHTIWLLDTRELNAERVNLIDVNSQINHPGSPLRFPNVKYSEDYEFELFSYTTEEYYGVIFPELNTQWKMYYKNPLQFEGRNDVTFPWLRDSGEVFNIQALTQILGQYRFLNKRRFELFFFDEDSSTDFGREFKCGITTKGLDLTYENKVKFLNNVSIGFVRGNVSDMKMSVEAYNEEGHKLLGERSEAFYDPSSGQIVYGDPSWFFRDSLDPIDKPSLFLGKNTLDNNKLGVPYFTTRRFEPKGRFPFLYVILKIEVESGESFHFSTVTFHYQTTDIPTKTLPKLYRDIIREE